MNKMLQLNEKKLRLLFKTLDRVCHYIADNVEMEIKHAFMREASTSTIKSDKLLKECSGFQNALC